MKRLKLLTLLMMLQLPILAQHTFKGASLSEALIELDGSSKRYDIMFVYDELEDFTVTKTIGKGRSLPDAVREVCGFYPVRVQVLGREIYVECLQKQRTKLNGRLADEQGQPVPYANIILYDLADSVIMGGGVSNEAGDFVIPCSAALARVRISCVGFKTINRQMPIDNVGTIRMQMENNYLSNITVSGRIPVIRSEADRLQYIVSNDEFARGLNGQELLSRVPMVTMVGAQAMILGKGPAHFMLNGHITEMGDEAIRQKLWTMRSEDIDRIEVLSIPSGRDMMEMGGGYINIVMRRDQTFGWRGDISTEAGVSDDWSGRANGSVSFASEKFDMTIDAHGGRMTQTKDNLMTYSIEDKDAQSGPIQTTDNQTNDIEYLNLISETHAKQKDKELAANLMLRYQPTKYLELGGMLSCQIQWPEKVISGVASVLGSSVSSEAHQDPKENTTTKNLTAYCDWRFDSKGKRLSLTYSDYKKDDDGMSKVSGDNYNSRMSSYYGPSSPIWKYESFESEVDYHIQSARLDLTLPFRYITVDAGASYTNIRNQANLKAQKSSTMSYYDNKVNMLDYQEKTKSAYLSLHHDWGKLAIKAGLRYERIEWDEEVEANTSYMVIGGNTTTFSQESKDYWLPSASLSYKPLEGHQINISWGTGTIRPNFYDLNPFRIYKSTFEYSEGNPLLKPSRISNIELNYFNRHGLYACAYHHHSSDKVMMFTLLSTHYIKEIIRMDHAITTPYNDGRINQTGLYLRYQRQLAKHLMMMAEGDVFYHDATSRGSHDRPLYGWGKRMAISADWYLDRRHTLLLSGRYQHWFADYHDMTKTDGYGYFCFALRYAMLDDRLKLSLVANDPFRQHITDETIYNSKDMWLGMISEYMEQHLSHTNHHSHYIGLTATYTLGGKTVRHIRHDMEKAESKRAERQ